MFGHGSAGKKKTREYFGTNGIISPGSILDVYAWDEYN
jgi:hypothetical protein